jgi:hypothetical protein
MEGHAFAAAQRRKWALRSAPSPSEVDAITFARSIQNKLFRHTIIAVRSRGPISAVATKLRTLFPACVSGLTSPAEARLAAETRGPAAAVTSAGAPAEGIALQKAAALTALIG